MQRTASIPDEEKALIEACAHGDARQWDTFVSRYDRLIRATSNAVRLKVGAWQCDLDDLVGNAYERLLQDDRKRLRAWRGQSRFSTYLVQVTKNLCLDYIRKYSRDYRMVSMDDIPERRDDRVQPPGDDLTDAQQATLKAEIEKLPPKQAMIIKLRMQGKSLREIAELLHLPQGTVFAESSRAVRKLRKALDVEQRGRGKRPSSPGNEA